MTGVASLAWRWMRTKAYTINYRMLCLFSSLFSISVLLLFVDAWLRHLAIQFNGNIHFIRSRARLHSHTHTHTHRMSRLLLFNQLWTQARSDKGHEKSPKHSKVSQVLCGNRLIDQSMLSQKRTHTHRLTLTLTHTQAPNLDERLLAFLWSLSFRIL